MSEFIEVPRRAIAIPTAKHTLIKLEPAYVLKLYQAIWRGKLKPGAAVEIVPMPQTCTKDMIVRKVPADNPVVYEASRLRAEFGAVFDHVYPDDSFDRAFERVCKTKIANIGPVIDAAAVERLIALPVIGKTYATKLVAAGFDTVAKVANADASQLAGIMGHKNADLAIEAALLATADELAAVAEAKADDEEIVVDENAEFSMPSSSFIPE